MGFISCFITPLVIYNLKGGCTCTLTDIIMHAYDPHRINFKKPVTEVRQVPFLKNWLITKFYAPVNMFYSPVACM